MPEAFAPLFLYWQELAKAANPPLRASFDPIRVPHLLKDIATLEVLDPEGEDFLWTLMGTRIATHYGSITNMKISELEWTELRRERVLSFLRPCVTAQKPHYGFWPVYAREGFEFLSVQALCLPFICQGPHVDRLVILGQFVNREGVCF